LTTIYQRKHTHTFWPPPTVPVNNHYRTLPLIFMSYSSYEISLEIKGDKLTTTGVSAQEKTRKKPDKLHIKSHNSDMLNTSASSYYKPHDVNFYYSITTIKNMTTLDMHLYPPFSYIKLLVHESCISHHYKRITCGKCDQIATTKESKKQQST
ncbi:hypothetical protein T12_4491, partial [Trichinella patagoniensis]